MLLLLLLLAVGTYCVPLTSPVTDKQTCGYNSCTKYDPEFLNVHIVAHTHDDVGWLKTVDQYYYGSSNYIQKAGVQYILDSVVKELWEDPKRRFIYVETAFFWKWWVRQSEDVQGRVHTLVREGRLQFVGGAWSMNDEAASHYQSTIDQFTWGLHKLNATFGRCGLPRVGWQIDPFGHSREFSSLLAGMGYDGLFLGRIDYQDKAARMQAKHMEMLWRGDDDLGKQSDIFTGVLYNTYSPPPGFCFDVLCNDEPIVDDPDSPLFNVDVKVDRFLEVCKGMASRYTSRNVLVTMGDDFQYQDAGMWFTNLDKLIEYTNLKAAKDGLNVKVFYSTPDCYLKAVKDANPTLPTKQDDFFPYASDSTAYWTGYFTSRPTTKYFEREANDYLQMLKQLQVLGGLEEHNMFVLDELKSALGIMQHHDAITGTEKQHVTRDYERILDQAIEDALIIARQAYNKMMQGDALKPPVLSYDRCHLNESRCYTSENSEKFVVTVFNPMTWAVNESIRIPVVDGTYQVYAPNADEIDSQLTDIPIKVQSIPTRKSIATHEIVFIAYLKPLSYKSYYIKRATKTKREVVIIKDDINYYDNTNEYWRVPSRAVETVHEDFVDAKSVDLNTLNDRDGNMRDDVRALEGMLDRTRRKIVERPRQDPFTNLNDEEMRMLSDEPMVVEKLEDYFVVENENIKLHIDNTSGEIKQITHNDRTANVSINFFYYPGCVGNNESPANRSSGAYIFRPNATKPIPLEIIDFKYIHGKVFKELRYEIHQNVFSVLRLYDNFDFVEHEWIVGPIDIQDDIGKEFIVRYQTDILNNGEFYTDSNGRQMLKRKLNTRPQWNLTLAEPIAGNYYPVTNEIFIQNDEKRVTILTDRSQGGTSLVEGDIELMLHRRLLHDDAFGVGEALNETAKDLGLVVRGKHKIMLSHSNGEHVKEKKQVYQTHLQPIVLVSDAKHMDLEDWLKLKNGYTWLTGSMPEGLHLLTLEPWDKKILMRVENYLNKGDHSTVELNFAELFKHLELKSVRETVLSANQWLDDYEKWSWNTENEFTDSFNDNYGSFENVRLAKDDAEVINDNGFNIKMKAKQIRTFVVDYEYKD